MKKILLLTKSFVILSLLFCSIGVFAEIPKTINVQGKLTNDSGGPITNIKVGVLLEICENSDFSGTVYSAEPAEKVPVDSEGLYNADVEFTNPNIDFGRQYYFKVTIDLGGEKIVSDTKTFASSPYAFYSSTSTYSLVLDPVNGEPLVDGNFNQSVTTWNDSNTYKIAVGSATYAKNASTATWAIDMSTIGKEGQIWGVSKREDE